MKRWQWVSLIVVGFVCSLAAVVFIWLNQPVSQPLKESSAANTKADTTDLPAIPITTAYFSTTVPSGFKAESPAKPTTSPQLVQMSFNYSQGGQLSITIGLLPVDGLEGVGDYNFRLKLPETYSHSQFAGMPSTATAFFSLAGDNEVTVFWPHTNLYAMLSVSGSDEQNTVLRGALVTILDRWRWL